MRPSQHRSAPAGNGPADFAAAFGVSRETVARLETYAALLRQWQKAVNLVAVARSRPFGNATSPIPPNFCPRPRGAQLARSWFWGGFSRPCDAILLADAACQAPLADCRDPGPGVPPRVTLIESDTRKAAFLGVVARQTGIAVDILSTRIETCATKVGLPRRMW